MNSWPATYKHHKLLVLFTQIQLLHKGLGSGEAVPLPENFSILDLKMATSGAFWAQFVYSSGACFVLHGKQCFYVKLNPADELHYLQQRPRRNVQMPIRYWNSCFKDDHFVLFSACI